MDPLSITAATLAMIQAVSLTYDSIKHLKGLPKAIEAVGSNLTLVEETLALIEARLEGATISEAATKGIEAVLQGCQEKAKALRDIFQEINKGRKSTKGAKDWSSIASYYRTMVLRLGKAHRVETLMQDILDGLKGMTMNQVFKLATERQIQKLEEAIQKLAVVEPSIKESEFEQGGTNLNMHVAAGGKGNQFHSEGTSQMTNNLGPQFTASGNMIFVSHYHQNIPIDDQKRRVLVWLGPFTQLMDFEKTYWETYRASKKLSGWGQWFLSAEQVVKWRSADIRTLWCRGIRFVGKTHLASLVISQLKDYYFAEASVARLFIYFNHKSVEVQRIENILASLLDQLLRSSTSLSTKLAKLASADLSTTVPDGAQLLEMLLSQLEQFQRVFIVVDGLDECADARGFLDVCGRFPESVHLLFTSWLTVDYSKFLKMDAVIEVSSDKGEMREFLIGVIADHRDLKAMIDRESLEQPNFSDWVVDKFMEKSEGLLHHARLQVDAVANIHDVSKFIRQLKKLSKTVDNTYSTVLKQVLDLKDENLRQTTIEVLTWITFARRPLTVEELGHAVAISNSLAEIKSGVELLPKKSKCQSIDTLTAGCAGLVHVAEEFRTDRPPYRARLDQSAAKEELPMITVVSPCHITAQGYLEKNEEIKENARTKLADVCLTCLRCLRLPTPQPNMQKALELYPLLQYAANNWPDHMKIHGPVNTTVYQDAWETLTMKRGLDFIVRFIEDPHVSKESCVSELHLTAYFGLTDLVARFLSFQKSTQLNAKTSRGRTPLHWAVQHNQVSFLRLLIDLSADPNVPDGDGKTILHLAINNRNTTAVAVILTSKVSVDLNAQDLSTPHRNTPLISSIVSGQDMITKFLLDKGADTEAVDVDGWTALRWAAWKGHRATPELLKMAPRSSDPTMLSWAAQNGLTDFIQLLIKKKVDLNTRLEKENGCTALALAVKYGRGMTAWLLLQHGADVNQPDNDGYAPIHEAVRAGQNTMLFFLLESGANINAQTKTKLTPLHLAASKDSKNADSALWFLLQKGASVTRKDIADRTPLHWAIMEGQSNAVHILLRECEEMVDAEDHESRTALHYAASYDRIRPAELLLAFGAKINVQDADGSTPLYVASHHGYENMVSLLLRANADFTLQNKAGWSAIRIAEFMKHGLIVARLQRLEEQLINDSVTRDGWSEGDKQTSSRTQTDDRRSHAPATVNLHARVEDDDDESDLHQSGYR